jgi:hypothetical protein
MIPRVVQTLVEGCKAPLVLGGRPAETFRVMEELKEGDVPSDYHVVVIPGE